MAEKDLNELFLDTLKDIYYAEKQILKALAENGEGRQFGQAAGRVRKAS